MNAADLDQDLAVKVGTEETEVEAASEIEVEVVTEGHTTEEVQVGGEKADQPEIGAGIVKKEVIVEIGTLN